MNILLVVSCELVSSSSIRHKTFNTLLITISIYVAVSCLLALGVNISNYLVLGKTSPLTYQVLGHMKTVLILVLGFTIFRKPIDLRNVIGIAIAMVG